MRAMSPDKLSTQPEDFREILAWVAKGNWVAIIVALGIELYIRYSQVHQWPHWGNFSLIYNLVLIEFAVVNFGITMMLRRTAWLDSAPREALARLRSLMLAVLVLDVLHLLGFFRVAGGFQGPFMVLLPPILLTLCLLLPRRDSRLVVSGFLIILLIESMVGSVTNTSQGMLAESFSPGHEYPLPWLVIVAIAVLLALFVGFLASRQMTSSGINLRRGLMHDPLTGLFARELLERRLQGELGRIRRSKSSASLLLISVKNVQTLFPHEDFGAFERLLREVAGGLLSATRGTSDTCARYDATCFAALLPMASSETVTLVVERILECTRSIRVGEMSVELAVGAACISASSEADVAALMSEAEQALQTAQLDSESKEVEVRTL